MKKIALITGITGQDGSYLAEYLIKRGYIVHGIKRRSSIMNTDRIDHLYEEPWKKSRKLFLHYGDLTDGSNISYVINKILPDEIYNLAAQSHVMTSFEQPEYTANVNAIGTLRVLEAVRSLRKKKKIKIYQASTSELFGAAKKPQNEKTPFYPKSPYATSKLFAYWISKNYRESYDMFISNGILFNHESERRGETFVSRKITIGLSKIILGKQKRLYLGNLNALRDWGYAKDYAEMQHKILQQKKPDDFVIATGKQYTVRNFVEEALKYFSIKIKWKYKGLKEIGIVKSLDKKNKYKLRLKPGDRIIEVKKSYFRPNEVDDLLGDAKKAKKLLNWTSKTNFKKLVFKMVDNDFKLLSKK